MLPGNFLRPLARRLVSQKHHGSSKLTAKASFGQKGKGPFQKSFSKRTLFTSQSLSRHFSQDLWDKLSVGCMVALPIVSFVAFQSQSSDQNLQMSSNTSQQQQDTVAGPEDFATLVSEMEKKQSASKDDRFEEPVYRIVLTGGPCGGKSTALSHISDRLSALGFRVFCVPEAATLLITGMGTVPPLLPEHERITFEGTLLRTKIALEDTFVALAKATKRRCVVLCDRGTMDTAAYMDKETFDLVLSEFGMNVVDLRDRRYDGVIHLVTAAIGATDHYGAENNTARHESIEEARNLDFKVLNAWVGHPRIRIVDNSTDWKGKLSRVLDIVCQYVGAPRPNNEQRKFILGEFDEEDLKSRGITIQTFEVEQTYLAKGRDEKVKGYTYLRRRGQNGIYTYTLSSTGAPKISSETGENAKTIILERSVTGREFLALLRQGDSNRLTVKKKVHCFVHNNNYYEIHQFVEPNIGLTILNTEIDSSHLPDFLSVPAEVTGLKQYSSYFISKHFHKKDRRNRDWKTDPVYTDRPTMLHENAEQL